MLRRHGHLLLLLLITLLGGGLRFYQLDKPRIWLDEALTFSRVTGTWAQMTEILRYDGFMPLHYFVTWALVQVTYPTPEMLRLVPALCGTIMVPAMYMLARQMTGRRQALLAALLTACSAYLLAFSRDAKMYMQTWCFVTLFVGLLLCWLYPGRKAPGENPGDNPGADPGRRRWWGQCLLWLAWVSCGAAAVWFHGSAMIVVGLSLVFMFTAWSGPWWRWLGRLVFYGLGVGIIAGSCWWYYHHMNLWHVRSGGIVPGVVTPGLGGEEDVAKWERSGLTWIPNFHRERTPVQVARHSLSSYLLGWEWPANFELHEKGPDGQFVIPRETIQLYAAVMGITLLGLLAGLFPWSVAHRRQAGPRDPPGPSGGPGRPWPIVALWLSAWLLLPTYVFYCRSFPAFASPLDWVRHVWGLLGWWWPVVVIVTLWLGWLAGRWRLAGGLLWLVAGAVLLWSVARRPQGMGHEWLAGWWQVWTHPLLLGLAVVSIGALAWQRSAGTQRLRWWNLAALIGVAATLLLWCGAVYEIIWLSWIKAQAENFKWVLMWWPRYLGVIQPALWIAVAILVLRLPTLVLRGAVIGLLVALNLGTFLARIHLDTDAPWDQVALDIHQVQTQRGSVRMVGFRVSGDKREAWSPQGYVEWVQGKYYYCLAGRILPTPEEFRGGRFNRRMQGSYSVDWNNFHRDIARRTSVQQWIVWERWEPGPRPAEPAVDPYLARLGEGWTLQEQRVYRVREHHSRTSREWNWQQREWLWRKVYGRKQ